MTDKPLTPQQVGFCLKCQIETERTLRGRCKPCANRMSAEWRCANPEKSKASSNSWKAANPDANKAGKESWLANNLEKSKADAVVWKAKNPEKVKAYFLAWQAAHPESVRLNNQNQRARKRETGGKLSSDLAEKLFKKQKGKCPCCGLPLGENYHLDHIMPLFLGGLNIDDNIQLLRQRCNNQKSAKHPIDFMQSRGFLL